MLKISLRFKKFTNVTAKLTQESLGLRMRNVQVIVFI